MGLTNNLGIRLAFADLPGAINKMELNLDEAEALCTAALKQAFFELHKKEEETEAVAERLIEKKKVSNEDILTKLKRRSFDLDSLK